MDLFKLIEQRKIIELSFFKEKVFYTGVCLSISNDYLLLINFNEKKKSFDGYSIFRYQDLDYFTIVNEKEKRDERNLISHILNSPTMVLNGNFTDCIKASSVTNSLIAFFLKKSIDDYYVGKIISLNEDDVELQLFDSSMRLGERKRIVIKDIKYIGFGSKYEKKLKNKLKAK